MKYHRVERAVQPILADKVAVVTGGASGIGKATAELLATQGAAVVIADLDEGNARSAAGAIAAAGGQALALRVDMRDEAQVRMMVDETVARFGGVDLLDNTVSYNAPDQTGADGEIHEMDVAIWNRALEVNLRGPMLAAKYCIPQMLKRGGGAIVNISSTAGILSLGSVPAYAASKAAVHSLSQSIATAYGKRGIRCNTIAPGFIDTPTTRNMGDRFFQMTLDNNVLPYLGRPDDIAQAALFLLSDAARYITGQLLAVDGGQTIHLPVVADMWRMTAGKPLIETA
ncbi:SDR family NAD(P)-dependent oxidoreductase [Sphingobium sp. SA916]|uniref:SDR family NAD(P)-dependent oxidoreductase n=1 Tax=Sphingobium sp. SA916 TaxID=1851207 RepID=UPI001558E6F1|nr:SDR family NAD(P)-dependent oxidoreductase [Sphingobium sp. SA916]